MLILLAPQKQAPNTAPHPFVLAQALQSGSCISFETALGHYRFYPLALTQSMRIDADLLRPTPAPTCAAFGICGTGMKSP